MADVTVQELIDMLEGCNPDAVVKLALQPRYPLIHEIQEECAIEVDGVVYIGEDDWVGNNYAPEGVAEKVWQ